MTCSLIQLLHFISHASRLAVAIKILVGSFIPFGAHWNVSPIMWMDHHDFFIDTLGGQRMNGWWLLSSPGTTMLTSLDNFRMDYHELWNAHRLLFTVQGWRLNQPFIANLSKANTMTLTLGLMSRNLWLKMSSLTGYILNDIPISPSCSLCHANYQMLARLHAKLRMWITSAYGVVILTLLASGH